MTQQALPSLLLFDLGKVLVEVTGTRDIQKYLINPLQLERGWPAEGCWDAFERGQLPPEAFATRFIAEVPLNCDCDTFLADFANWSRGLLPGSKETLEALRPRFRLAALSNSNVVHWQRNVVNGIPALFERVFSSHELGMRKPEPEIYEHVLKELEVAPATTTFFDDTAVNVEAAQRLGMQAYRVEGVQQLRSCLLELGYLDGEIS
jgi:HAD superfamily hydrolase (TIGR01509 family)